MQIAAVASVEPSSKTIISRLGYSSCANDVSSLAMFRSSFRAGISIETNSWCFRALLNKNGREIKLNSVTEKRITKKKKTTYTPIILIQSLGFGYVLLGYNAYCIRF